MEFRALAKGSSFSPELGLFPDFGLIPAFEESAPTFAENSLGKALHYSRHSAEFVLADDSGLVVPSLEGRPGVHSARYAGENAPPDCLDNPRIQRAQAHAVRPIRARGGLCRLRPPR